MWEGSSSTRRSGGGRDSSLPSLRLSLAKLGAWLPDSWEELLKDDGGRLETSAASHTSVDQSQRRKGEGEKRLKTGLYLQTSDAINHSQQRFSALNLCLSSKPNHRLVVTIYCYHGDRDLTQEVGLSVQASVRATKQPSDVGVAPHPSRIPSNVANIQPFHW